MTPAGHPSQPIAPLKKADKAHVAARQLLLERLRQQEPTGVRNWSRDELYERTP